MQKSLISFSNQLFNKGSWIIKVSKKKVLLLGEVLLILREAKKLDDIDDFKNIIFGNVYDLDYTYNFNPFNKNRV